MELFLNSVWMLVVVAGVWAWPRHGRRRAADRYLSVIALAMLIVILFPVISVSDDLWSSQNLAETDTCQRRDHRGVCPYTIFSAAAALPEPTFAGLTFGKWRLEEPQRVAWVAVENPALAPIQNRPPPAA